MREYSQFFRTLYDQASPLGEPLGRGTHHSVLRAVFPGQISRKAFFHDFAVIWDEDHDERVIWIAENLYASGLLENVIFLGERKGGLAVLTRDAHNPAWIGGVREIAENAPNDCFSLETGVFPPELAGIMNVYDERARDYLRGIDAVWKLGSKACVFTSCTSGSAAERL